MAKPDRSLCLYIDYRHLNKVTATNSYLVPRIEELIDRVAPAEFISTMNLAKGYYQVPMAEAACSSKDSIHHPGRKV